MHYLCIFLICFCSKIIFNQKVFSFCWGKLDYLGSIAYLSCFPTIYMKLMNHKGKQMTNKLRRLYSRERFRSLYFFDFGEFRFYSGMAHLRVPNELSKGKYFGRHCLFIPPLPCIVSYFFPK